MTKIKKALVALKCPIAGILALNEISAIGSFELVLDDWYIKKKTSQFDLGWFLKYPKPDLGLKVKI